MLCCGTVHSAQELVRRSFTVTDVDNSLGMLELAREKVPKAHFRHQNATSFTLTAPVDAALCMFESINHLLSPADLLGAFRSIFQALKPGAALVFDADTPGA